MSNGKIGGFFVPDPISGSYVANKKNEQGSLKYDADLYSVGMQKQAALQDLEKSYETTINKAYNTYLANQQAISGTAMGQGYKELYEEAERENLLAQQEQTAANVANVRAQLQTQEAEALNLVRQQGAAEAANLSRVARSMSDYLTYVKSLSNKTETGLQYLSKLAGRELTENTLAEEIYDELFKAQPADYTTEEDEAGLSYSQWLHNQMKETDEDLAFEQWLFSGGGWEDFRRMAGISKEITEEGQKYAEIEQARQEKRQEAIDAKQAEEANRIGLERLANLDINSNWYSTPNLLDNTDNRKALGEKLGIDLTNAKYGQRLTGQGGNEYIFFKNGDYIYVVNGRMSGEVRPIFG